MAPALVNEQRSLRSFIVALDALVEGWRCPTPAAWSRPTRRLLALAPELVLLGTGATSVPACRGPVTRLQRGIGLEVMTNGCGGGPTHSVLAGEAFGGSPPASYPRLTAPGSERQGHGRVQRTPSPRHLRPHRGIVRHRGLIDIVVLWPR